MPLEKDVAGGPQLDFDFMNGSLSAVNKPLPDY
jgi:hypothetical protein